MGKLIAIDGVDASGKETQTTLLAQKLKNEGYNIKRISFPMYDKPSSILVKEYLSGKYGENPNDVNAYSASILFAADRFSSYRIDWEKDYNNNTIIIADRYVSSNMIHQAGKIENQDEKKEFLHWVYDLEYIKLGLPKPDITIFLDMPTEYAIQLMSQRLNKIDGNEQKDIHESNHKYLKKSYLNAILVAELFNWERISCVKDKKILPIEEISDAVLKSAKTVL